MGSTLFWCIIHRVLRSTVDHFASSTIQIAFDQTKLLMLEVRNREFTHVLLLKASLSALSLALSHTKAICSTIEHIFKPPLIHYKCSCNAVIHEQKYGTSILFWKLPRFFLLSTHRIWPCCTTHLLLIKIVQVRILSRTYTLLTNASETGHRSSCTSNYGPNSSKTMQSHFQLCSQEQNMATD